MRPWRRTRFPAALAVVALLFATSALRAHSHDAEGGWPASDTQCQLCLQFGSAAGPAATPSISSPSNLVAEIPALRPGAVRARDSVYRPQNPRAPPFLH